MNRLMQRFFKLEAYSDPVEKQRATNLFWVIYTLLVLMLVSIILTIPITPDVVFTLAYTLLVFFILGLGWSLNQSGYYRVASWIISLSVVSLTLAPVNTEGDYQISTFLAYALWLTIILAGLVMPSNDIIALTLLCNVLLAVVFAFGGRLSDPLFENQEAASQAFFLVATSSIGTVSWLIARNFSLIRSSVQLGETRRNLLLQQTTGNVARQITMQLDLETLLNDTVELIRQNLPDIYHAQVFLIDSNGKRAELRASTGEVGQALIAKKHALEVGSTSVIGRATQSGEPVLVSDTSSDPVHKVNELLPNTLTELAIPMRTREGVIGALDVQSTKRNAFSEDQIQILQDLANQIAIAIENARLYTATQEEAQRAKALVEASQITSQLSMDFDRGLATLFETITAPGQYTHWWFGVVTDEGILRCVTSHKALATALLLPYEIDLKKERNSLADAYRTKRALVVNDLEESPHFQLVTRDTVAMFGKHIASPIMNSETREVVGVLLVGRDMSAHNLGNRDLELVSSLTSQLSVALQNRNLFYQVEREQKRLQAVLNTMPISVVVVNHDLRVVLANEQAQLMLGHNIQEGASIQEAYPILRAGSDDFYPSAERPLYQALKYGDIFSAEDLIIQHPDGSQIDVLSKAAPLKDDKGQISAVVVVYQDITELRELERALQESLSETTKLYEASRAISHATDIATIAEAVINQMLILSPDMVYMTLRDTTQQDFSIDDLQLALSWPHERPRHVSELGLPLGLIMPVTGFGTTNFTFATHNLRALSGLTPLEVEQLYRKGINAVAVLPLEARNEVFGAIIALFKEERLFAPEERRFLLTLADQASVAIDAVMSFQSTQNALRTISRLYQASRAIASEADINEAIRVIQEQISVLNPDRIIITLARDQEGLGSLENVLNWSYDDDYTPLIFASGRFSLFDLLAQDEFYIEDIFIEDENPHANFYQEARIPYQAIASIPFRAAGQPTGRLIIGFKSPRRFSHEDRQFLRMVADSTAYVIENDLLFKQTQDSLEETGVLYQAIRAFANAEDKHGILQAIIDYAADPQVDKAMLCLLLTERWDSHNALMEVVVSWVRGDSVDLTGMRFTAEQFPSWEQISTDSILFVDDIMTQSGLDDTAQMGYRALDIASFVIIPLAMGGNPIGAILLGSSEPRSHTDRELRIYQSLADQAAITMENKRLFEEAERRARQLATSAQVGQVSSSILKLDELLPQVVDLIKDAFGYDQVQIFLLNKTRERAVLQASTGEAGRQLLEINHSLEVGSHSVVGTVTKTGEPSIALDTADARVVHKPNPYLPNTRSEMAIPLKAGTTIVGALDVQSNQPGAFTDSDLRVLSVLCDQLAVSIVNASLFATSERRTEEMRFLFTVAEEATIALELEDMLQRVASLLSQQMQAHLALVYIYNAPDYALDLKAAYSTMDSKTLDLPAQLFLSNDNAITRVASNRIASIVQDYHHHHEFVALHSQHIRSGIYVPLVTGDVFVGVIGLESTQMGFFDREALELLQTLTGSLAAVIQSQQLLEDIQEANERLREIDKLKTNFLAAMSHELRTPLNSIIGFSRVILKGIDGPVTDMQRQDLQTIHDSGKHLLGLVNDILDQAKIEAGKMELATEYFDVTEEVRGVMSSGVGLTKEKPIRLQTEIAPNLPLAYGDKFRTRQVLLNLISNAAKFTEQGTITTTVTTQQENDKYFLQISVTDTGIGIKSSDFSKLFESFQQVDSSTTRSVDGTGLGLPLAKALVELQGGTIRVESEFGYGSTFTITIPTEPAEKKIESQETPTANGSTPAPLKIIIILEENVDLLNLYRRHLSKAGYDVLGATSLEDAKEKMLTIQPTAILVNTEIDEEQGWNYLAELVGVELPQPVPIISSSLYDNKARSSEMGASFHLVRPFEPATLLKIIQQLESRTHS